MTNDLYTLIKHYLTEKGLTGFQAQFKNSEAVITIIDNSQIKPITSALKEACDLYGLAITNPIKSVNIKTKPGIAPIINEYDQKVKVTYSEHEVRANFEDTTSINLNRKVFILTKDPNKVGTIAPILPQVCEVDKSYCLLTLHHLETSDKETLVEEFPECQKCFDLEQV